MQVNNKIMEPIQISDYKVVKKVTLPNLYTSDDFNLSKKS